VLANLGSPDRPTPAALRRYLRQFLSDRRVVDLPRWKWLPILYLAVLPWRPRRSARLYRTIWTDDGAPLPAITHRLARRLAGRLAEGRSGPVPVAVGMRYGAPAIGDALARLDAAECRRVLVLPLYPQYSVTTTASVYDAVADGLTKLANRPQVRNVASYFDHPAYVLALASSVEEFWDTRGPAGRLIVSFHGIPQRVADAGDPYPVQCDATATALAGRLGLDAERWSIAYQSRFGRESWLEPALDERLTSWGRRKVRDVDVICPGFAADCLETLEEVAISGRELFVAAGGAGYRYIPALNDRPEHVAALADIVRHHTSDWTEDGVGQLE
jgi:ferrochelatase